MDLVEVDLGYIYTHLLKRRWSVNKFLDQHTEQVTRNTFALNCPEARFLWEYQQVKRLKEKIEK